MKEKIQKKKRKRMLGRVILFLLVLFALRSCKNYYVGDVSGDLVDGEIPTFYQFDARWGDKTYGDDTMEITGCGPTCLSMVICGLTGEGRWDPYAVAKYAEKHGYYVSGSGSAWSMMSEMAEKFGLRAKNLSCEKSVVLQELEAKRPIICIMGPGDFTTQGHFIVMTGVTSSGKIIVHDPNSRENTEKTWEFNDIQSQIRNLWSYELQ